MKVSQMSALALLATTSILSGCDGETLFITEYESSSSNVSSETMITLATELEQARALWSQHEHKALSYDYYRSCFCFGRDDFHVEWESGGIVRETPLSDEETPIDQEVIPSIETLFDQIASALAADHEVQASFNPTWGYPENVSINTVPSAEDTTTTYSINNFAPTSPYTTQLSNWQRVESGNYQYTLISQENFFFSASYDITVREGVEVSRTITADTSYGEPRAQSINDIFNTLSYSGSADRVHAEFDPVFHYPSSVFIDYETAVFDDELSYTISDFTPLSITHEQLSNHLTGWESLGMQSYSMTVHIGCFCSMNGPVEVTVEGGKIARAYSLQYQRELTLQELESPYLTIHSLFKYLQQQLDLGLSTVEVIFDQSLHFPIDIMIDREGLPVDAGIPLQISDFKIIELNNSSSSSSVGQNECNGHSPYEYDPVCNPDFHYDIHCPAGYVPKPDEYCLTRDTSSSSSTNINEHLY